MFRLRVIHCFPSAIHLALMSNAFSGAATRAGNTLKHPNATANTLGLRPIDIT
jgi:hypothetical protein